MQSVPSLDVFVLVVTRDVAQLRVKLGQVEEQFGIDVVILDAEGGESPLEALILSNWSAIERYFGDIGRARIDAIRRRSRATAVSRRARSVVEAINEGCKTYDWLRRLAQRRLAIWDAPNVHPQQFGHRQRIHLRRAVYRSNCQSAVADWWKETNRPVGLLEADEGMGKTWIAAAFAWERATDTVALWLESREWAACDSIEGVLLAGLRTILPEGDLRLKVCLRKALSFWSRPILLVLDGVNEWKCLEAAQHVLLRLCGHEQHFAKRIRILFTSRPILARASFSGQLWQECRRLSISPWADAELEDACRRIDPPLRLSDIPIGLLPLARVPRYFSIAVRLRERLRGLTDITKPILLFADLMEKLESDTGSVRQMYGSSDIRVAEARLADLARRTRTRLQDGWEIDVDHLYQCFPHLGRMLDELAEGKVLIDRRPESIVLSDGHVALGCALYLLQVGERVVGDDPDVLMDHLARALEPALAGC